MQGQHEIRGTFDDVRFLDDVEQVEPLARGAQRPSKSGLDALRMRTLTGFDDARDWILARQGIAAVLVLAGLTVLGTVTFVTRTASESPTEESLPVAVAINPSPTDQAPSVAPSGVDAEVTVDGDELVVVQIAGAVVNPGVYRLVADKRVQDIVLMAGGLLTDADAERLNLAARVVDGSRIHVPLRGEPTSPAPVATIGPAGQSAIAGSEEAPVVDVNRADLADLVGLPGIGPATASAILEHRGQRGSFRTINDLLDVNGIGPSKLAAISDRIVVR